MVKHCCIVAVLILFFFGCKESKKSSISFYYWKTTFKLSEYELNCLRENNVKTLYVRYFDIDLDKAEKKPYPVSTVKFAHNTDSFKIVPVIYIKNNVMLHKETDLNLLAANVSNYVEQINTKHGIYYDEIQLDCDWTLESRDRFMEFIDILKITSKKKLSATIRLHQVKYHFKTKIPAVDYGVLMYYNMGTIAADTMNSVYDREIALKYLSSLQKYPLKLDVALPIFSRGVHVSEKKVKNLISKVDIHSFDNDSNFFQISENMIKVINPNFKFGYYFKKDDEIKLETINFKNIKEMVDDLEKNLKIPPAKIIFFDLDSTNLSYYKNENQDFKEIVDHF